MSKSKDGREIVLWSCDPEAEEMSATDIEEAVTDWIEYAENTERPVPETIAVYGYARMVPSWPDGHQILDNILEALDDDGYGSPEEYSIEHASDLMKKAADVLADVIKSDYKIWSCEIVHTEEVKISDYRQSKS